MLRFLMAMWLAVLAISINWHSLFFATNHFVRSGATGTATGADWTNAFTDLPASLTCGDLYYVSSGTYGKHTFNDGCSVVTEVRAATIADHGTSTGWNNSFQGEALFTSASATNNGCIWEVDSSHYLFNGNGTRSADWQSGYLIRITNSNQAATNADTCMGISAGGTVGAGTWVQDVTWDYINFDGPHNTTDASCSGGNNCVNVFTSWCGSIGRVAHSLLHDGGNVLGFVKGKHDSLVSSGSSLCNASSTGGAFTFEYNYFFRNYSSSAQHGEGMECDEGQYCIIRYNRFRDITGTAFIATPSGCGRTTCNIDNQWDIYGNWFESKNTFTNNGVNCGVSGAIQVFDTVFSGPLNFYNNTLININSTICSNNAGGGNLVFPGAEADFNAAVNIRNNYWHNNDNFTAQTTCPNPPNTCASTWTWDNSVYGGGQTSGGDSSAQTIAGNLFVSITNDDFHLTSNTNTGVTLGSPFNTDQDGVTRGGPAPWSRGAFQFIQAGGAQPAPAPLMLGRILWNYLSHGI